MSHKQRNYGMGQGEVTPNTKDASPAQSPCAVLFEEASKEVDSEIKEKYKAQIKAKLLQKKSAELVLANIEREIHELKIKISQEL